MEFRNYLSNMKILYVEDDKTIHKITTDTLKKLGFDLVDAYDGVEGLELFNIGNFNLIISDINMPKMDGISMVEKIREIDKKIPIIFTTAFTEEHYLLKSINLGINAYIQKPVNIAYLKNSIEELVKPTFFQLQIEEQNKIIEKQNRDLLISKTVAMISHQWKQPLSKISSITTKLKIFLEMKTLDDNLLNEDLNKIEKQAKNLSKTIDKFQDIVSSKSVEVFEFRYLVDKVFEMISPILNSDEIKLINSIDKKIEIVSNINEFSTIILNIINNSLEQFEKEIIAKPMIKIEYEITNKYLIIVIKDNAKGFDNEYLSNQNSDFYNSNKSLNNKGLGLYLARTSLNILVRGLIELSNYQDGDTFGAKVAIKIPKEYVKGVEDDK